MKNKSLFFRRKKKISFAKESYFHLSIITQKKKKKNNNLLKRRKILYSHRIPQIYKIEKIISRGYKINESPSTDNH